jgi:hypothetical protein
MEARCLPLRLSRGRELGRLRDFPRYRLARSEQAPALWFAGTWTLAGLAVIGVGLAFTLPVATALTVVFGITSVIGNTVSFSETQKIAPQELLRRYYAPDEAGSFPMISAGQIGGGFLVLAIGVSSSFILTWVRTVIVDAFLFGMPSVRNWGRVVGRVP